MTKEVDDIVANIEKESKAVVVEAKNASNGFTQAVDIAKVETLKGAAATDEKFNKEFIGAIKDAALEIARLEKEKAALEKQNIEYEQELLETQQKLNEQKQVSDLWENRQKRRQYHFDGVRPIMEFVGVKTPMNLPLLYFLTFVIMWFFLLDKVWKGTIGALISGASDGDRPKAVKGFIWTVLGVLFACTMALGIYLVLGWLSVI